MTGNRLGDLVPTSLRLLLRPQWKVPAGLRFLWVVVRACPLAVSGSFTAPVPNRFLSRLAMTVESAPSRPAGAPRVPRRGVVFDRMCHPCGCRPHRRAPRRRIVVLQRARGLSTKIVPAQQVWPLEGYAAA
jgi:hypothetical protein